jgi:hypothetical protein
MALNPGYFRLLETTMTAMKKSKSKPTKSPAPATKTAKPSAKRATAAKAVPAVKPVAPRNTATTITAQIDVGFGNLLHIRGEGPGLSWDRGVPMECVADNQWQIVLAESVRPVVFKFLVNDLNWSTGEDYTVAPGNSVTLTPTF